MFLSFIVNIAFHVFILFTFLTLFFFSYVTKLTESHIDAELKDLVQEETTKLLQQTTGKDVNWKMVNLLCAVLEVKYRNNLQTIDIHNKELYDNVLCILMIIGVCIGVFILYALIRGFQLRLKFIFLENMVTFIFVGLIEIYFFTTIASKYIPVMPDDAIHAVISRLKWRLKHE
jgi:hypothetical protein